MAQEVEAMPLDIGKQSNYRIVMDVVASPPVRRMVRMARNAGLLGIDGLTMTLSQAGAQLRLYTGHEPPMEAMRRAAETLLSKR